MNFSTANSTFRQLMGNGLSYRVPLFQRDYSWGPNEWDDLWQDIVALFGEDPEPAHYMGYLVLQSSYRHLANQSPLAGAMIRPRPVVGEQALGRKITLLC